MYKITGVFVYSASDPQIKVLSATGATTEITIPIDRERSVFDSINALIDEASALHHWRTTRKGNGLIKNYILTKIKSL